MKDKFIEKVRQQMIERYPDFVYDRESAKKRIEKIAHGLKEYFVSHGLQRGIVGMSGGLDSTVTAAILKRAEIETIGLILPIHQKPEETLLGLQAAKQFCDKYAIIDLTHEYETLAKKLNGPCLYSDGSGIEANSKRAIDLTNLGNIRARLRMITLYDTARHLQSVVMSTDNLSELFMGFWTLHGDTGDISPIQAIWKGFELRYIAQNLDVPKNIIDAMPTDGLGISLSDEAQLGANYFFVDAVMCWHLGLVDKNTESIDIVASDVAQNIINRYERTRYKRSSPLLIEPFERVYKRLCLFSE